jgi:hypothetical protein
LSEDIKGGTGGFMVINIILLFYYFYSVACGNTTIKWYTNWGRDGDGDEDGDGEDDDDDDDNDDGGGVVGGRGTMTCKVGDDDGATQQSN